MIRIMIALSVILFTTTLLATVTVSGRCVDSETPDSGISDVEITMTGQYGNYSGSTDSNGYFSITGVEEVADYEVNAVVYGYLPYTIYLEIGSSDIDMGDLLMVESLPQVLWFSALLDGRDVVLSWGVPQQNRELTGFEITRDDDIIATLDVSDTTFTDVDLPDGVYTYGIRTLYSDGYSIPVTAVVYLYTVNVSGYVTSNINPDEGLDGAVVVLESYPYVFEAITVEGDFLFEDIPAGRIYTVDVSYDDGQFDYQSYMTEMYVSDINIDIGTIMLYARVVVPHNLIATESPDQEQVVLSWTYDYPDDYVFRYDDGYITGQLGYGSGGDDVRLGAVHYNDAEIYEIKWYLTDEGGPHDMVDLYIYGLDENGLPDYNNELFSVTDVANTDLEWNTYELAAPVNAPEGFYIGINYPEGFLGLGTDDGEGAPYNFTPGTQCVTNSASTNDWHDPQEYGYPVNFAIRAVGENNGELDFPERSISSHRLPQRDLLYIDGFVMPEHSRYSRMTTHMTFYWFDYQYHDDPSQWNFIYEGDFTENDTTYVDQNWGDYWGEIQFVMLYETEYGETGALSSNIISHCPPLGVVTLNVTTNSGDSAAGASVVLENQDGDDEHIYIGHANANGSLTFPVVWPGIYDLSVVLPWFDDYTQENLVLEFSADDHVVLDIELEELLLPVTEGCGSDFYTVASLWWYPPFKPVTEDFEAGIMPAGWEVSGICEEDTWFVPGFFTVTNYSDAYYDPLGNYYCGVWSSDNPQDEWLITPSFTCWEDCRVTWWSICHEGSDQDEHMYLKISEDDGNTWDILWDASELDEGLNSFEQEYCVDLSNFADQEVKLAWNCVCEDGLSYPFFIDNITIEYPGGIITFDEEVTDVRNINGRKQAKSEGNRSLLGYRIERDGTTIVELQTETCYFDYDCYWNLVYNIYAVYQTGESEPYTIIPTATNDTTIPEYTTALLGNSPNPFNPETSIGFSLAKDCHVVIEVFNVRGQRVKLLANDLLNAGSQTVIWKGDNDAGDTVSSGIYFYRMKVDGKPFGVKKMMMMK